MPEEGSVRFGFQWNWTADQHGHLSLRLFASPAAGRGRPALAPGPCPTLVLRRAAPASATPSLLTAEECSVARTGRALVRLPPVGVSTLGVTGAAGSTGVQACGLGPALCVTCGGTRGPVAPRWRWALGAEHGGPLSCAALLRIPPAASGRQVIAGPRQEEGHPVTVASSLVSRKPVLGAVANPWSESWSQPGNVSAVHFSETLVCVEQTGRVFNAHRETRPAHQPVGTPYLGMCPHAVSCQVLTTQVAAFMWATCALKRGAGYSSLGTGLVSAGRIHASFPALGCHVRRGRVTAASRPSGERRSVSSA